MSIGVSSCCHVTSGVFRCGPGGGATMDHHQDAYQERVCLPQGWQVLQAAGRYA